LLPWNFRFMKELAASGSLIGELGLGLGDFQAGQFPEVVR